MLPPARFLRNCLRHCCRSLAAVAIRRRSKQRRKGQPRGRRLPLHSATLVVLTLAAAAPQPGSALAGAAAKVIMGVVSPRSAAEMAAAAAQFRQQHPGFNLRLRTVEQLAELDDAHVTKLWQGAHAVLLAGLFGEQVPRLERLLGATPPPANADVVVFHSDLRLTHLTQIGGVQTFREIGAEQVSQLTRDLSAASDWPQQLMLLAKQHPAAAPWLEAKAYWQAGGTENLARLLTWLALHRDTEVEPFEARASIRYLVQGRVFNGLNEALADAPKQPVVPVLDYDFADRAGDREVHEALRQELAKHNLLAVGVLARWGQDTVAALQGLQSLGTQRAIVCLVALQDFVLGGGEGRAAATQALVAIDRPVMKAIRLDDRSAEAWRYSHDGLPADAVHYRVAMPEVQGAGQPIVLAAAGPTHEDEATGLRVRLPIPLTREMAALAAKLARWHVLQTKPRAQRRVALVYYNHPPGRHNVGADNLDVPASLMQVLRALKQAGYNTGPLPRNAAELLAAIQERGINLPENRKVLAEMAGKVTTVEPWAYSRRFARLPKGLQADVQDGPLAALWETVKSHPSLAERGLLQTRVVNVLQDVRHMLEGVDHPARQRALSLLGELEAAYLQHFAGQANAAKVIATSTVALRDTGIEGVRGWGEPPGRVMAHEGRLLIPGIQYGNVFLGPQPPRGWEVDEELLHANTAFAPHHQYLAYYDWLREDFKADVVVHVGRHSTYEFLPGHSVGLPLEDASRIVMGDVPSVYIYIVDGVGEGIQAKRRGHAVIVDHLTPPLATTPLYDQLLELRQLVETYEASSARQDATAQRAVATLRQRVTELHLKQELAASMKSELDRRGIGIDEVNDDLLVHEVGHYLTRLQEQFMPFGLHVFGQPWARKAQETMLRSMTAGAAGSAGSAKRKAWRKSLAESPHAEQAGLLHALHGGFIAPAPGNDPVRNPEVLPTGRNFHALDGGVLPTRVGYAVGHDLAEKTRAQPHKLAEANAAGGHAVVLWASDTVRDEGAMVAFGMDLLGIRPVWNSRGIVIGVERVPLAGTQQRRDTMFVTSGLFRDLYGSLLNLLDRAVLMALDGAAQTLHDQHPDVREALEQALSSLGEARRPGNESLEQNLIAARWLEETRRLVARGVEPARGGRQASLRVFGNAPGGYGAGVNRLAERSGAWSDRSEVADAYIKRMGHAYGAGLDGAPMHEHFRSVLRTTSHTFLGRASNLYGLLDNNDGFDYLGGLSMAVERSGGAVPSAQVLRHSDNNKLQIDPLEAVLYRELRGRHLHPQYLKALMSHGYAGARTMGNNAFEYLWGWQVTNPEIVKSWVWDEVRRVYLQDGHAIGLTTFLRQDHNVHVLINMHAMLLVAAHKGFWEAKEQDVQHLARRFAELVLKHGLPGSGHTRPDHPVMAFISQRLEAQQRIDFEQALKDALMPAQDKRVEVLSEGSPHHVQTAAQPKTASRTFRYAPWLVFATIAVAGLFLLYARWRRR